MFTIISYNCDGRLTNWLELTKTIESTRPGIISLQDPPNLVNPMIKTNIINKLNSNYQLIHQGKVATIIDTTSVRLHNSTQSYSQKAQAINSNIEIPGVFRNKQITLSNIYIRPRTTASELEQCLSSIENAVTLKSYHMLMGDANATSPTWAPASSELRGNQYNSEKHYNNIKLNRGRRIDKFINHMKLWCASSTTMNQPTHRQTYIDIALLGNKIRRKFVCVEMRNVSQNGHKALIIKLKSNHSPPLEQHTIGTKIRHKFGSICASDFMALNIEGKQLCNSWSSLQRQQIINRMNMLAHKTYHTLLQVQHRIAYKTPSRPIRLNKNQSAYTRKLVAKLSKAENRIKNLKRLKPRTTNGSIRDTYTTRLRKATKTKQQLDCRVLQQIEREYIEYPMQKEAQDGKQSPDQTLWYMMDRMGGYNQSRDYTESGQSKQGRNLLKELIDQKFPHIHRRYSKEMELIIGHECNAKTLINKNEFKAALKNLHKKNYTGPEGLRYKTFIESSIHIEEILFNICAMSFHTASLPRVCTTTLGTVIPKRNPGQFRIVHIGTPLSGLLEQIALHRLEFRIEHNLLDNKRQYGFTALRSRHDLIARIIENIIKHKRQSKAEATTDIISLDIEGAFDNVDHDTLIDKMLKELEPDSIQYWTANFLLKRSIRLKINEHTTSKAKQLCKGVPQGSPLGPILWNYFINTLDEGVTTNGKIEMLAYADDIFIINNGKEHKRLQAAINQLITKLDQLKLNVSPNKCSMITIRHNHWGHHGTAQPAVTSINIKDQPIPTVTSMNILGVTINRSAMLDLESPTTTKGIDRVISKLYRAK